MRVTINTPPGIFADGALGGIVSQQDGVGAQIVIELNVALVSEPVHVALTPTDLATIVRLARSSTAQTIRDAVR
jgi:hypothetical protein